MGAVRGGPPTDIVLMLKDHFGVKSFVELGTFTGRTAEWASRHFDQVRTVEFSQKMYDDTVQKLSYIKNIDFIFGDSREVLNRLVPEMNGASIFWLDSHCSSGDSYGKGDECPLMAELEIFKTAIYKDHILLIDDARLFLSPPPTSHTLDSWPTIDKVMADLTQINPEYYIVVFEDVIIATPASSKPVIAPYMQQKNTDAWNANLPQKRTGRLKEGTQMIVEGTQLIIGAAMTFIRQRVKG